MYLIKLSNNVFYTRISTPVALQTSLGYPREIRLSLLTSIFIKDTHLHFSLGYNAACKSLEKLGRLKERLKGHTLINLFDNAVIDLKTNLDVRFRNGLT
ncbi:hypothetical protein [Vibrio metschnikovii]|uniref:hypothetical protein n=1 Tax=Vibrio metschnikovii TaxID=28172 RepID=UPI001C2F4A9A|nr:hypothetical protein [Vibrio metschnikovii]